MTGYPRPYGKYVLLEPIGAGGMSEVDLAHRGLDDTSFVRFVAIKRVARSNLADEGYVRMFMDEARINAELHHGNIVQVFDFGKVVDPVQGREEYFMVMEYVPGLDLRALQRAAQVQGQLLPLRFSLAVLSEVLCGLQYAHTKVDTLGRPMNLVHRDINPRNVMVSVAGEVKVIDFGVALAVDRLEKTQGRSLKGKFAYMSPEQIEGNVALDGRTDLYAVGLMLHELVEGQGPFHGLTELQIMHRIVMGQVPELQSTDSFPRPDLLRRVHSRALARDRDRRYPDAITFKRDIDALGDLLGGLASQEERAAVVHGLAPSEVDGIGGRLRHYHEHSQSVSRSVSFAAPLPTRDSSSSEISLPPGADATASLGGETQEMPKDLIERPDDGGLRRLAVVAAAVLGLGLLFAVGAGVGLAFWLRAGPAAQREPHAPPAETPAAPGEAASTPPGGPSAPIPPAIAGEPAAGQQERVAEPRSGVPVVSQPAPGRDPVVGTKQTATRASGAATPAPREQPSAETGSAGAPVEPPPPAASLATVPPQASPTAPGPAPAETTPPAPAPTTGEATSPASPPVVSSPVAPEPSSAPGPMGMLMVTCTEPGQVMVDGRILGATPLRIPFPQGTYTVVVLGPAGELCRQQATVSSKPQPVLCRPASPAGGPREDDRYQR